MDTFAIEIQALSRVYESIRGRPNITALDDVSMRVERGEIRGLLGPNGAGKTTLIKVLATVLLPTSGSASVLGHDVVRDSRSVRPIIGVVLGGDRGFYSRLTGRQNLEYWASLYHLSPGVARSRSDALLERFGLSNRANDLAQTYSRGMKQRLHVARSLMADPSVLILDEPTSGMDPIAAHSFRQTILDLRAEGRTILIATHDMAEAEAVCDNVALINKGKILALESPKQIRAGLFKSKRIFFEGPLDSCTRFSSMPGVVSIHEVSKHEFRIDVDDSDCLRDVLQTLISNGITDLRTSLPTLEEAYLQLLAEP